MVKTESNTEYDRFMTETEAATLKELMKAVVTNGTGMALNDIGVTIAERLAQPSLDLIFKTVIPGL